MRYTGIFFDLDGTLVDTAPDFHAGVNRLRQQHGQPGVPYPLIRAVVSDGARAVISAGFPDADAATADQLREAFLADYQTHLADLSHLFPGLDAALSDIEAAGLRWGVVTNKPSRYTNPLMQGLGLDRRSAATVSADEVSQTKPHPEPLFKAAAMAGVEAARCIYVGDHPRDIEAGRRAGMLTVAAGWGYIHDDDRIERWGADVTCPTVAAFRDWLQGILGRA